MERTRNILRFRMNIVISEFMQERELGSKKSLGPAKAVAGKKIWRGGRSEILFRLMAFYYYVLPNIFYSDKFHENILYFGLGNDELCMSSLKFIYFFTPPRKTLEVNIL